MRRATALIAVLLAAVLAACSSPAPGTTPTETTVRVASLKGPTTMGLVRLIDLAGRGGASQPYSFSLQGTPDAVSGPLVAGDIDIALVSVNLAAILYNKTGGGVKLAAVNTLGVFYLVSGDPTVTGLNDLAGRTVISPGKGTTPQFILNKVLGAAGLADSVTIDYRSQPTEVASLLATDPTRIALLPEPYVTAALAANPAVRIVADLNEAWQQAAGSPLVTDCVAVRTAFASQYPTAAANFLSDYAASVAFTNEHPDQAAPLIVAQGLAPSDEVAEQAIPRANIVYLTGDEAKQAVNTYLAVLFAADPDSVGGALPDDGFYYNA